jgi:hypothetical protein
MLNLVVISNGSLVHVTNVAVVVANTVSGNSLEQDELRPAPQPGRIVEGQVFGWFKKPFLGFKLFRPF